MKKSFLLLAAGLIVLSGCARSEGSFDQLAQCMTDKGAIMYGADTCPHCQAQKKAFKGSFDLINYVECRKNPAECEEAGITGYPTWSIDGKMHSGKRSLSELAELSGCTLK